jgi:transcription elongation GreA/GreB family factor
MTPDNPLTIALNEVSETRLLVQALLNGSENFDYPEAKKALRKLQRKERTLARLQARYQSLAQTRAPNLCFIDFKKAGQISGARPQ